MAAVGRIRHVRQHLAGPAPAAGLTYASDPPCYFPVEGLPAEVLEVTKATHNSKVIKFGLPDGVSLNLPVSSCIMLKAPGLDDGEDMWKPYNPISSNADTGSFELLIKTYDKPIKRSIIVNEGGACSVFAGNLKPGDTVEFKQLGGNVKKWQYPFGKSKITMIACGTGITPMVQALYPLLTTPGDTTKIRLIYSNATPDDIMLKDKIDRAAAAFPDRLEVTYVVGTTEDAKPAGWTGEVGWIDEDKIKRLAFPPAADAQVWVCGTEALYKSLAGSRMKDLAEGSALHSLGYTEEMLWRS